MVPVDVTLYSSLGTWSNFYDRTAEHMTGKESDSIGKINLSSKICVTDYSTVTSRFPSIP